MKSNHHLLWSSWVGTRAENKIINCNYSAISTNIINLFSLLAVGLLVQICPVQAESPPALANLTPDPTTFERADETNGTLIFGAPPGMTPPHPLKTGLVDVKYLGVIRPPEGAPYFLLSAKPCKTCADEPAVFAVRPNDRKPTTFVYPGKILDPKSRALLLESRAFFGKCLPARGEVYVIFQQERVDRRSKLQASVLVEEAAKDHLNETLLDRHTPRLQTTLQQVKRKLCHEVEGRNRLMLSRPLDLHPQSGLGDDVDEEENVEDKRGDAHDTKNHKGAPPSS